MIIGTITQQPADRIDYDIDCSDLATGTDTVSTVSATVSPIGLTVSAIKDTGSATRVKVWVSGGTAGVTYKVDVTVTTTLGRTKQDELRVKIKEY